MAAFLRLLRQAWTSLPSQSNTTLLRTYPSLSVTSSTSVLAPCARLLFPKPFQAFSTQLESSPVPGATGEELVPERLYTKINIKVKGFDYAVLDSYMKFVATAGKALGIEIGNKVALPTEVKKYTVLKSPHIYKKHRAQYEMRTHARLVQVKQITGTTADVFLEYIQRNLPEGATMSVYQEELEALPKLLMTKPDQLPTSKPGKGKTKKGQDSSAPV